MPPLLLHYFFLTKPEGRLESNDSFFSVFVSVFEESTELSSFLSETSSVLDSPLSEEVFEGSVVVCEEEYEPEESSSYQASGTVISSLEESDLETFELLEEFEAFEAFEFVVGFFTAEFVLSSDEIFSETALLSEVMLLLGFDIS